MPCSLAARCYILCCRSGVAVRGRHTRLRVSCGNRARSCGCLRLCAALGTACRVLRFSPPCQTVRTGTCHNTVARVQRSRTCAVLGAQRGTRHGATVQRFAATLVGPHFCALHMHFPWRPTSHGTLYILGATPRCCESATRWRRILDSGHACAVYMPFEEDLSKLTSESMPCRTVRGCADRRGCIHPCGHPFLGGSASAARAPRADPSSAARRPLLACSACLPLTAGRRPVASRFRGPSPSSAHAASCGSAPSRHRA
jgi:hypothetical protein